MRKISPHTRILLTILILGALLPLDAAARCASRSLSVWPEPGTPLPANGQITIEGYGMDQDFVRNLSGRNPKLVGPAGTVPLRVEQLREGHLRVTQAILVPTRPLREGRRYRLQVDGRRVPQIWTSSGRAAAAWQIGPADTTPPTWDSPPVVQPSTYRRLGCGPVINGHVAVRLTDTSAIMVRVTLQRAGGGEALSYDIEPREGALAIGHGMCSGPYELAAGVRYRATLVAVDSAGNATPAPGGPVTIVGPSP